MRDHAPSLSDFLAPSLSIECKPCGRRGRYTIARLMEQPGDAKLAFASSSRSLRWRSSALATASRVWMSGSRGVALASPSGVVARLDCSRRPK
jgi:hypothetical protein